MKTIIPYHCGCIFHYYWSISQADTPWGPKLAKTLDRPREVYPGDFCSTSSSLTLLDSVAFSQGFLFVLPLWLPATLACHASSLTWAFHLSILGKVPQVHSNKTGLGHMPTPEPITGPSGWRLWMASVRCVFLICINWWENWISCDHVDQQTGSFEKVWKGMDAREATRNCLSKYS